MDKGMLKTKYDAIKGQVIKMLILETGFSQSFVRQAISGDRDSELAVEIRKEFKKRYEAASAALKPKKSN